MTNLGGNLITSLSIDSEAEVVFSEDPYIYKLINLKKSSVLNLEHFMSIFVYLLSGKLSFSDGTLEKYGDTLQIENQKVSLISEAEDTRILIAGHLKSFYNKPFLKKTEYSDLKKVTKPWGYEIWITGEHPGYSLKKIFITQLNKTSLQYHRIKRETNVLFQGQAILYFNNKSDLSIEQFDLKDLFSHTLSPVSCIDVPPMTLHRLEALTDILLYEASTPHLDDVVRVLDDTNRENGRIKTEHESK
jgi:mannose-6-phosphate isomerase